MIAARHQLCRLLLTLMVVTGYVLPVLSDGAPAVWLSPDIDTPDFIDLFTKPEAWANARARVNVFKFGPRQVSTTPSKVNSYADLVKADAFRKLKEWRISIAIEAPAVKEWDCTGNRAAKMKLEYIQNVRAAGGAAQFIAMDEPVVSGLRACHLSLDETAARTAAYVNAVSEDESVAPRLSFGDIEAYPSYRVDQLTQWIKALETNDFKPGFFHLDVDINNVDLHPKIDMVSDLRALRVFLQQEGIPFGVIFWSGHDPERSDQAYYDHVIGYVKRVRSATGKPEQSIFQSWVLRVSRTCTASLHCSSNNTRCSSSDPAYCGMRSVPINLPENSARAFSHTRLINEFVVNS